MSKKEKIPVEEIKKIPIKLLNKLLDKMRDDLKENEIVKKMFKDNDVDIEYIYLIPMTFADLDVSAKTQRGVIYFNYELLCDGDFKDDYQYGVHEILHAIQQCFGEKPTQSADDGEYLKNPFEQAAFKKQMEFVSDEKGKDEAEDYVDDLIKYHEITNKKDKKDIKETLLEDI